MDISNGKTVNEIRKKFQEARTKKYKIVIVTYEYNKKNKRETLLGTYENYEKTYVEWIALISRYTECEGQFAIIEN